MSYKRHSHAIITAVPINLTILDILPALLTHPLPPPYLSISLWIMTSVSSFSFKILPISCWRFILHRTLRCTETLFRAASLSECETRWNSTIYIPGNQVRRRQTHSQSIKPSITALHEISVLASIRWTRATAIPIVCTLPTIRSPGTMIPHSFHSTRNPSSHFRKESSSSNT